MRHPRTALLSLAAGAWLALSTLLLAPAAQAAPTSTECLQAEQALSAARNTVQAAQAQLLLDRSNGASNSTILADEQRVSQAQGAVTIAQSNVNLQCGTTGGGAGLPGPRPRPVPHPTPGPVGFPFPGGTGVPSCAQLAAYGLTNIPAGSPYYHLADDADHDGIACETTTSSVPVTVINGVPCHHIGTTWVPVNPVHIPVGTITTVNGTRCHWTGTAWEPVPVVTAPAPCNCDVSAPVTVVQQPPAQVVTVQQPPVVIQQPVTVPAQQVFTSVQAPTVGAVATGDGTVFGGVR